jgi:hypothetical protein
LIQRGPSRLTIRSLPPKAAIAAEQGTIEEVSRLIVIEDLLIPKHGAINVVLK